MEVRMTADGLSDYQKLPLPIRARVVDLIRRLEKWPEVSGYKPLHGNWKGCFRLRTGDWRMIFKPVGNIVWIVRIDNRRDVYGDE
jgi:mRNA-degrading endonuclease RelE of RelBE toxin-antitoxin system